MNILHITDLHYNSDSYEKFTQHNIINKLNNYLKNIDKKIDLVIFSGDLVFKGINIEDFKSAKSIFLDKISESLNISNENIILCAGNHDMDRTFKSKSLESRFDEEINNLDKLYSFFLEKDLDYKNSIKTTENYNIFKETGGRDDEQTTRAKLRRAAAAAQGHSEPPPGRPVRLQHGDRGRAHPC